MYDYIIVGAGSAGCVLANRLSQDPANRVLLLEAGPSDWHPFIHMPAGLAKLVGKKGVNWDYSTAPEPALGNRPLWWPRGKVLGGSSSINAMCYIRGNARDYDEWAALGADGWHWDNVLPYFKRSEGNERGGSEFHGGDGPLGVSDPRHRNPLSEVFLEAARQAGHAPTDDFNGARQEGFGWYQTTTRDGARSSSARAYLKPVRKRPNLTVITGATASRVTITDGRATGVVYSVNGKGAFHQVAGKEVILSGGAINSPQLLMLSGIGPAAHLRQHGITVVRDLPGVGGNLQDHLDVCTLQRCVRGLSYDQLSDVSVGLQYYLFRKGPGTSNIAETGGFLRSSLAEDERPDIQFHFVPAQLDDHGRNLLPGHGYTLHACGLHPRSRGRIHLASASAGDKVRIEAGYLSDPEGYDLKVMLEALRLSREILAQPAFAGYRGEELQPGAQVQDEAGLVEFIRRKAESIYHPVGTCRMGRVDDPDTVVDPQLRVVGVAGLRVVDASVMPKLVSGNTNAPTMMIAERAADLILGKAA
ncbi:MAG TPA: choline dehydrogenase [Arenimonas sp.]|nr:choline dehydrogenase [Arenimonas sp.]